MLSSSLSAILASALLSLPAVFAVDIPFPPISYSYGSVSVSTSAGPKFSGIRGEEPLGVPSDCSSVVPTTSATTTGSEFSGIHDQEPVDIPFIASHTITTFSTSTVTATPRFSGIHAGEAPEWDTAIGGALDPSRTLASEARATVTPLPGDGYWTVIKNNAGQALQTMHTKNIHPKDSPKPPVPDLVDGQPNPGQLLAAGASSQSRLRQDYSGRIAIAAAGKVINGWESLTEFSLETQGLAFGVRNINISYVDGFTFPIMCRCNGVNLSGCDNNLWKQGKPCLEENGQGACKNPHRYLKDIQYAHEWYKNCEHKAYTYSLDDAANSNGKCQSGTVVCTINPGK